MQGSLRRTRLARGRRAHAVACAAKSTSCLFLRESRVGGEQPPALALCVSAFLSHARFIVDGRTRTPKEHTMTADLDRRMRAANPVKTIPRDERTPAYEQLLRRFGRVPCKKSKRTYGR